MGQLQCDTLVGPWGKMPPKELKKNRNKVKKYKESRQREQVRIKIEERGRVPQMEIIREVGDGQYTEGEHAYREVKFNYGNWKSHSMSANSVFQMQNLLLSSRNSIQSKELVLLRSLLRNGSKPTSICAATRGQ